MVMFYQFQLPEIGSFELVVESVECLRKLRDKFADPEEPAEPPTKRSRVGILLRNKGVITGSLIFPPE